MIRVHVASWHHTEALDLPETELRAANMGVSSAKDTLSNRILLHLVTLFARDANLEEFPQIARDFALQALAEKKGVPYVQSLRMVANTMLEAALQMELARNGIRQLLGGAVKFTTEADA